MAVAENHRGSTLRLTPVLAFFLIAEIDVGALEREIFVEAPAAEELEAQIVSLLRAGEIVHRQFEISAPRPAPI